MRRLGQRRQGGTLNGIRRTDGMNAFITEPPEFQLAGDETSILKKKTVDTNTPEMTLRRFAKINVILN